jgi:hypothetical protein
MAPPKVHSHSVTVVVIGKFNARIFEPLWLSKHGLIAEGEALEAERMQLDKQFGKIGLPWAELVVLQERLQVDSQSELVNASQVRDLVVGVLRLLPHTPVTVVSIHHRTQLSGENQEQWHAVGDILAPKEVWEGVLDNPGMLDFAMQGTRPDQLSGAIKVRIQPSPVVPFGVFMNVNDEFQLPDPDDREPAGRAAELIEKLWPAAESRSEAIRSTLLERLFP